jgi:outer membrane protein assembly factor BamA
VEARPRDSLNSLVPVVPTNTTTTPSFLIANPSLILPGAASFSDHYSAGGLSKYSLLALLSTPLPIPKLVEIGAKAFTFVNLGGLGSADLYSNLSPSASTKQQTEQSHQNVSPPIKAFLPLSLLGTCRVSVGAGVMIPVASIGRLEFTYSVPLVKEPRDQLKKYQIGLGVTIN